MWALTQPQPCPRLCYCCVKSPVVETRLTVDPEPIKTNTDTRAGIPGRLHVLGTVQNYVRGGGLACEVSPLKS